MSHMVRKMKTASKRPSPREGSLLSCSLLGMIMTQLKTGPPKPDLLYAFTRQHPDAQVDNTAHVAATILCNSRYIYQSHLLFLLTTLDPNLAELCYLGKTTLGEERGGEKTRSCVFFLSFRYGFLYLLDETSSAAGQRATRTAACF